MDLVFINVILSSLESKRVGGKRACVLFVCAHAFSDLKLEFDFCENPEYQMSGPQLVDDGLRSDILRLGPLASSACGCCVRREGAGGGGRAASAAAPISPPWPPRPRHGGEEGVDDGERHGRPPSSVAFGIAAGVGMMY